MNQGQPPTPPVFWHYAAVGMAVFTFTGILVMYVLPSALILTAFAGYGFIRGSMFYRQRRTKYEELLEEYQDQYSESPTS